MRTGFEMGKRSSQAKGQYLREQIDKSVGCDAAHHEKLGAAAGALISGFEYAMA